MLQNRFLPNVHSLVGGSCEGSKYRSSQFAKLEFLIDSKPILCQFNTCFNGIQKSHGNDEAKEFLNQMAEKQRIKEAYFAKRNKIKK